MTEKTKTGGIKSWINIFKASKKRVNHNDGVGVTKAQTTSSLSDKSLPTSMSRSSTATTQSSVANKIIDDMDVHHQSESNDDGDKHTTNITDIPAKVKVTNSASTSMTDNPIILPPVKVFWQYGGDEVFVTGTFDNWSKSMMMEKQSNGSFTANIPSNDKAIVYKFVVDGVWKYDDSQPTEKDKDGNINNVIKI